MLNNFVSNIRALFYKTFPTLFSRIAIIAVVILPLIYSALYLWAFWDPYNKIEDLPVAFVNQDKGGWKDGKYSNLGLDLEIELHSDHNVKWIFASLDEANQGLQSKKFYSYVWIPADFTQSILSVDGIDPQKARITLKTREASNVISARIVNRVGYELSEKMGHKITEEYFNNIFIDSRSSADDLGKAVDGAKKLNNGLNDAQKGSLSLQNGLNDASQGGEDLTRGLNDAYLGSNDLKTGVATAYQGSSDLLKGLKNLQGGSKTLKENLSAAYAGAQSLMAGAKSAAQGASAVLDGTRLLSSGSGQVTGGLKQSAAGAAGLYNGLTSLKSSLGSLEQGIGGAAELSDGIGAQAKGAGEASDKIAGSLNAFLDANPDLVDDENIKAALEENKQLKSGLENLNKMDSRLSDVLEEIQNGLSGFGSGADALVAGAAQLNTALPQLSAGSTNITTKLGDLQAGENGLVSGLNTLASGETSLVDGLKQLDHGGKKLYSGMIDAEDGANKLNHGLMDLKNGSQTLLSGLWSLRDGGQKLVSGLDTLSSGSQDLANGLSDASSGSQDLYQKLNDGYEKNMSKVAVGKTNQEKPIMADPVVFNEEMVDPVKTYGTGFTPYFVPLSMWVGAMAIFLVTSAMATEKVKKRRLPSFVREVAGRFLWLALVGILQAVVLCTVLIKVLGLQVNHPVLFYLFTAVLALLSIAIFQFLTYLFGMAGDFIGVILLMLQLTSSGGSYPKETLPPFFVKIGPYLPMTYSVTAFRDIISGGQIDVSSVLYSFSGAILLLILFTGVFKWIFNGGLGMIKQSLAPLAASSGGLATLPFIDPLNRLRIANLRLSHNFNQALGSSLVRLKEINLDTYQRAHTRRMKAQTRFNEKLKSWQHFRDRRS